MPPDFLFNWTQGSIFAALLISLWVVSAAMDLILRLQSVKRLTGRVGEISPVLQTLCGTLFVLSVTFLASSVWQIEERAREAVSAEARGLRTLGVLLEDGKASTVIATAMAAYGREVEKEWPDMDVTGGAMAAERALEAVYAEIVANNQDAMTQQRLLTELDAVARARQERLSIAQSYLSAGKWTVVLSLGLLVLVVIAICHAATPASRGVALGLMSVAIALSLFAILAHDRPFQGYLGLTPESIAAAAGIGR